MSNAIQSNPNVSSPEYSAFIALSRYARWLPEENRRETWEETVDRYVSFWENRHLIDSEQANQLRKSITDLDVMPSMRALMTAGKALEIDNVAGFNCSYTSISRVTDFDEVMYISECGTGVGFSCERQFIQQLPVIGSPLGRDIYRPEAFPGVPSHEISILDEGKNTIRVADSKYGWASALRILVVELYNGNFDVTWDVSNVRPAGAPLKIFGGRASGAAPLVACLTYFRETFEAAQGRKLNSAEVHGLVCKIAEVVVSGGVRRSALISLSNLSDDRMRHAKSGMWWETHPEYGMANNSVCYTERPGAEIFMREWLALVESKSGERGIFNREAATNQVIKYGKRKATDPLGVPHHFGTNPCCFTGDTMVAVADGRNAVAISQLAEESRGVVEFPVYSGTPVNHANQHGDSGRFSHWRADVKSAVAKHTGVKGVFQVTLSNGDTFEATADHPLAMRSGGYVEVQDSLGIPLETFFTHFDQYRHINAVSDGHRYQQRLIWEHYCGPVPAGFEVDHIVNGGGDSIENLQLLTRSEHLAKTAQERMGVNNPIHKADKTLLSDLRKVSSWAHRNGRWSGISDEELIDLGRAVISQGKNLTRSNLRATDSRFPLSFSANRFGGSFNHYREVVLGNESYAAPEEPMLPSEYPQSPTQLGRLTDEPVFVVSLEPMGAKDIYDLTVEDNHNFYILTHLGQEALNSRGILVHNSEIILRDGQFCNLTEVVVRPADTAWTLSRKIIDATILGTLQATLTDFIYLSDRWKVNTKEEALLGVSLTGILDNVLMNPKYNAECLPDLLNSLRQTAERTNRRWAQILDINPAGAITCVKPSGTVSQLVDSASGIHPRYSPFYVRTVRASVTDPLARMMEQAGFPCEPDVTKPDSTLVFSFPMRSPVNAVFRDDLTALEQLELWALYQRNWCEHKPSVTIYVREHEWMEVGAWVYKNFGEVSGVSFLPHSDHTYQQAPYQEVDEETFRRLVASMPQGTDWSKLSLYELEDRTKSARTLACAAGVCEVVDL